MKKRSSATPAEVVGMSLPSLNDEEMQQAYERARAAGKIHEPYNLRTAWAHRKKMSGDAGVKELVRIVRAGAASTKLDEPELTALLISTFIKTIVGQFEILVQSGALDAVLPKLAALPVLYSTKAGKGAPEWEWARELFEGKEVGTKAAGGHRGSNTSAARDANWGLLAVEAASLAYCASIMLPEFDTVKARAVAVGYKVAKRPGLHYSWKGFLYLIDDGSVLIWHDWLELCRGLPKMVEKNVSGYKAACMAMAKEFFGDPGNTWADELLKAKLRNRSDRERHRARLNAVRLVGSAVASLGVSKRRK